MTGLRITAHALADVRWQSLVSAADLANPSGLADLPFYSYIYLVTCLLMNLIALLLFPCLAGWVCFICNA